MGPLSDLQLDLVELETDDARDVIGDAKLASSFPLASLHSLSTSTCAVPCRARLGASCLMNAPNTSCAVVCRGTLAGARPWSSASPRLAHSDGCLVLLPGPVARASLSPRAMGARDGAGMRAGGIGGASRP